MSYYLLLPYFHYCIRFQRTKTPILVFTYRNTQKSTLQTYRNSTGPIEKTYSLVLLHANNKGTDRSEHPSSLISAFVVRSLKSIIAKLPMCIIQIETQSLKLNIQDLSL